MANGRNFNSKKFRGEKIQGGFSPIPWDVLDSKAYLKLSHTSRSLLLELARQVLPDNNGRLLLTSKYLSKRGWRSAGVISRAKRELLEAELIYETVMGYRPNKASWFAVTWKNLSASQDYDVGAARGFVKGAYKNGDYKITSLIPRSGSNETPIAPL
jgi:hypothetical protein